MQVWQQDKPYDQVEKEKDIIREQKLSSRKGKVDISWILSSVDNHNHNFLQKGALVQSFQPAQWAIHLALFDGFPIQVSIVREV